MRSACLGLVAVVLLAGRADAQDPAFVIPPAPPDRVFVNLNAGFRSLSQEFFQQSEFSLHDETGVFEAQHAIKGTFSFDAGAGVGVARNLAVGVAYTVRSTHTRAATVNAQVPHPLFVGRLREASGTVSGLEHVEEAVHVQVLWRIPVTIEFDVTLFGGPTFFRVQDDLVESITPVEAAGGSTVELSGIGRARQNHRVAGFHAGLDTTYMFMRHLGAGAMLRYSKGSVDLVLPPGSVGPAAKTHAGGLELGTGLRIRF